jgi:hypothetical protein
MLGLVFGYRHEAQVHRDYLWSDAIRCACVVSARDVEMEWQIGRYYACLRQCSGNALWHFLRPRFRLADG